MIWDFVQPWDLTQLQNLSIETGEIPTMAATKVGSCRSFAVVALVWLGLISIGTKQVQGSVHEYENAEFTETGNAFLLYGGSEGLFVNAPNNHGGVANGKSFIKSVLPIPLSSDVMFWDFWKVFDEPYYICFKVHVHRVHLCHKLHQLLYKKWNMIWIVWTCGS